MKKKCLNLLRNILRKTVLPIRKKREEWLSNFRFSMAFRISLGYLRLMLAYGVLFFIGFFIVYMYDAKSDYALLAEDIMGEITAGSTNTAAADTNDPDTSDPDIGNPNTDTPNTSDPDTSGRDINGLDTFENPFTDQGLTMKIERGDTHEVVYDDCAYRGAPDQGFILGIHYDWVNYSFIIEDYDEAVIDGKEYQVTFQYDMAESYIRFLSLAWKVLLLYLLVVALVIRMGKRSDSRLFEPVRTMSAQANRLTVNNLHSERLNVEGTKNELKDLANVINAMLDRIETSYESQKQFVSDASHELRTPIAVIQGYVNMLDRWGSSNEEVLQESIEAIKNEAASMQDLVEKLLFLSRHDKKTLKLTKKRFNMRPVVEDMVKETRLVATNRIIHSPVLEDVIVYGDKQALKQAIRVFIDNAVKYTKDGDTITILCQKVDGDCVITVSDTGIGMTKKDVDNIFSRFYRSENVRNQNIGGHGLGLSLAKLIILAHTGRIKVRSQFTKGSSFIITIPKRR